MYKVYPTLVDNFNYYLSSESMTTEEMIDRINRVPTPTTEAQIKGRGLNNLIDDMLKGFAPEVKINEYRGKQSAVYVWHELSEDISTGVTLLEYDKAVVDELLTYLQGATSQAYSEAVIQTAYGNVLLYGYKDYLIKDRIIDLKTTSQYTFPKYGTGFQHKCYLYTMRESGNNIHLFDYLITDFRSVFVESYNWHNNMIGQMKAQLNNFLAFVENNSDKIINKKLLGI